RHLPEATRSSLTAEVRERFPNHVYRSATWKESLFAKVAGHRSFLDAVAELLNFDQTAYLRAVRPYAQRHEVARLLADGFTIGAHTVDHPYFPEISRENQVRQAVESTHQIEGDFGIPCQTFAFPFGADGVQPAFYDDVGRETSVNLYFGVGASSPTSGCRL